MLVAPIRRTGSMSPMVFQPRNSDPSPKKASDMMPIMTLLLSTKLAVAILALNAMPMITGSLRAK